MATCDWCGGTGWGEAIPKTGATDRRLRVPCPNRDCIYRPPALAAGTGERRVLELWMCPECGDATVRTSLDSPWRRPCEGRVVVSRFERHAPTPPERVRALVLDAAALVPLIEQARDEWLTRFDNGEDVPPLAEAVFDALTQSGPAA